MQRRKIRQDLEQTPSSFSFNVHVKFTRERGLRTSRMKWGLRRIRIVECVRSVLFLQPYNGVDKFGSWDPFSTWLVDVLSYLDGVSVRGAGSEGELLYKDEIRS